MSIWTSFVKIWIACSCKFKANFLVFMPLAFWSRNYWDWLNHHLMANIWEKVNSILAENLNSCLSYLITTVRLRRFESECTICRLSIPYALNSETSVFEFDGAELIGCRCLAVILCGDSVLLIWLYLSLVWAVKIKAHF
jgi:hypothetical protein